MAMMTPGDDRVVPIIGPSAGPRDVEAQDSTSTRSPPSTVWVPVKARRSTVP